LLFSILVSGFSTGWQATCYLSIKLHSKDKFLLEAIQLYFGGIGSIKKGTNDSVIYNIVSIKEIDVIIAHFDKYPLLTKKKVDYYLFKRGVKIIQSGRHRSLEGIEEIVKIRAKLNWGLTEKLIASFPKIAALESVKVRPLIEETYDFNPYWVAGFVSAEGNFFVDIITSSTMKSGYQVILVTKITQHVKDEQLLKNLVTYLKCGIYYKRPKENAGDFLCKSLSENLNIVLPFFQKYPILGTKSLDFQDWSLIAHLIKDRAHLTTEGLNEIREIKSRMNTKRIL